MKAQDVKQILGERAKEIISNGIGLQVNRSGMVKCPLHNDKNPSMSWFKDGLMWRCHACGGQIDIYKYLVDYENLEFKEAVKKVAEMTGQSLFIEERRPILAKKTEYDKPNIKTYELEEEFIDYMNLRGITKETLDQWKVKQTNWNGRKVYVFQYFNEKEDLEFVSYRGLGKGAIKGGCEPNTKSILWGMWCIDKTKPVVITEGQPDAMVVYQSGYKNVVSVPSGSNNFKWIDYCWEWLQDIPEFIVFADNDSKGLEMGEKIKRKLNNVKVVTAKYKDANEVLFHEGEEAVYKLIDDAIKQTPAGILDVSQIEYKTALQIQEDVIETGFIEYDEHVEDWKMEEITVVFGRNGEGKSTYVSQIIGNVLNNGEKVFLYSGELSNTKIQEWIYKQMIGDKEEYLRTVAAKYRDKVEPRPEIVQKIKEWHTNQFFIFDRSLSNDMDEFFEVMEVTAKRYGVKLFVIDNLMTVLEENADSLNSDQANLVQACKDFAVRNKVHVVLVAHPNKGKGEITEGTNGNLEKTDISGSGNIGNKADNIIAVERVWGDNTECDAIVTSLKDRNTGQRRRMLYYFSKNTYRFYNNRTGEHKTYGWERELKGLPKEMKQFNLVPNDPNCPF